MKWYAYVIIALLILALGFSIRGCRQAEHDDQVTNLAAIDMMVEYKQEIDSMERIVAAQKHDIDSVTQHYAPKLDAANAIIKRQRGMLAKVADIIQADSSEFTEAQLHIRDSLIDSQDQQIANLYGERAALKVSTEALIDNLEAKARLSEDEVSKWIGRYQESEARRAQDSKDFRKVRRRERIVESVIIVGVVILAL